MYNNYGPSLLIPTLISIQDAQAITVACAGSFTAQFRTSPSVRHSGFRATVICFRQEDPPEGWSCS